MSGHEPSAEGTGARLGGVPPASGDVLALAERFDLPELAAQRLTALRDLVVSHPEAPTAVRTSRGVVRDHLADSLVALERPELRGAARVADLGSGAGFPGLALAVALPRTRVYLVESNKRKCRFLERAIEVARAENAVVVPARVESWADPRSSLDVVTARALASLAVVAEYAAPLLRMGGTVIAWRGRRDLVAEAAAARAAAELGLEIHAPAAVHPYPEAEHRHLHLMSKVRNTPERFPRRPGVAAKHPLGIV